MKAFLKKKYIWIPCLIVIAAGLIVLFVLKCTGGKDEADPSSQAPSQTASAEVTEPADNGTDPAGPIDLPDVDLGDTEAADTIDGGGDWDEPEATQPQDQGGQSGSDDDGQPAQDGGEGAEEITDVDTLVDDHEWSPIS